MLRMPSLLESRSDLLHLWTSLGCKRIQSIFCQWRLDALSIPHYVIKKERLYGARHGKTDAQKEHFVRSQRAEKMYQKDFWWNSRSFPTRSSLSWFATQCIEMDKLAQEDHSHCPSSEDYERYRKKLVYLAEQIGQECTDETPIRLPISSHNNEPTVSTENLEKNDQNQSFFINTKGCIRLLLLPVPHGGSGLTTGGAHNCFFFFKKKKLL